MSRDEYMPAELSNLKSGLYLEVNRQLIKDFHLIGIDPSWSEKDGPLILWNSLSKQIVSLLHEQPEKIKMLFYRIDLDERIIDHISMGPSEDKLQDLCKQLLIREIQKVVLRMQYKID